MSDRHNGRESNFSLPLSFSSFVLAVLLAVLAYGPCHAADFVGKGETLFLQKCLPCHTVGGGKKVGPDLLGITERRDQAWLVRWISNPEEMIRSGDPVALEVIKGYPIKMPAMGLTDEEIRDVVMYLAAQKPQSAPTASMAVAKKARAEVDLLSRTYLQFYEDARGNRYGPLNERLDLALTDLGKKWGFHASVLLRYDLRTPVGDKRELDELTYAYATFKPYGDERLAFNIGRNYVFTGVAAEHLDGISARWEFARSTGISVFGGRPVQTEFDGKRGDYVLGSRVYQRMGSRAEVGVSILHEDNDGTRFREEAGMDVWALPWSTVEIQGHSLWNNVTRGWSEHAYNLRLPFGRFVISGFYGQTNYTDAFAARTLSVFSPDLIGSGEGLTKTGTQVTVRLSGEAVLTLNGTRYNYRKAGDASYYGGSLAVSRGAVAAGLSLYRMDGETDRLRYAETRGYVKKSFDRLMVGLDAINLHYDDPFSGLSNAYSIKGIAVFNLSKSVSAGMDVDFSRNPDFTHQVTVLMKLVYNLRREL